jgi:hypothetical protein
MKHDRRLHSRTTRTGSSRQKRVMSVQQALEWAFRVEHAQLALPEPANPEREQGFGFGLEYVLMQCAALGCKIDGGQYKMGTHTHKDAEVIAATVAGIPDNLGGKRMAMRVAELARAELTPDWMPGAVSRCVPVEVKRNQHGARATAIVVGMERVLSRGKWRTVEILACQVAYSPHPEQIKAARQAYISWWQALNWLMDRLLNSQLLREVELTPSMPKPKPWGENSARQATTSMRET